ncbi:MULTISPECIES: peptidylprolyl isomerase [unclassified Mesorhizobium]|uniref:peptidylprolyl isomerase n=1 Tax=unclassified Mesorhizobium TaxID=325217 RepID=UPI0003CEB042|nr:MULTISPECIES: peptidylprolyl isomerase [unclassified Mesorhizobium]ESY14096.1 peptidylprolyl isomerase [Mesorhizobium sp. LNJC395A00]ESY26634.1 peptidylprolyl isomerase [Mesorhizobium sp. LNJC391B00]WJI73151.1 peptidylprolyl isomerase [Mesorhizobium sp. C395A]
MSLLFRRASLASLGLAFGLSALSLSPLMAQEAAPAPAAAAAAPAAAPVDPNAVIATVNGQKLTEADLRLAEGELSQQFSQLPPEQRRAAALSAAIEIRVMAAQAVATGLDKDPEFQRRMAFLQQRALHGEMVEKGVVDKVTDAEVRARYDQEIASTPPVNEIHARHILVKTKEEAEAIIKQLDGGADFQKLANEHTSDPSGKTNGGDLGWFGPGQMVPEFDKAAVALEIGKYTKEPVQTQFGWHVIKLEDKRTKQPPAFDDVKDQAKQAVIRDKYFALVKQLRGAAKVEIPDANLKKAVDTMEAGK